MWAALTGQGKKTPEPSADGDSASEYSDEGAGPSKVLKVSIGARDNGEKTWHAVNDDEHPTYIESEDFVGRVAVRVKDFKVRRQDEQDTPGTALADLPYAFVQCKKPHECPVLICIMTRI